MKEALKLCVAELREARGEVEEVMHNCAAALAGTEMGKRYAAQYRRQLARIDAAVTAAEAALARPERVAWMHEDGRVVPAATMATARKDGGATLSSLRGYTIPLYAGCATAASSEACSGALPAADFYSVGMDYAYTEATDPSARDDWTTEDIVKAFEAGARFALRQSR